MKGKISLPDLLVHNDPMAVNRILNKYGVRQARSEKDAVAKLNYLIARYKEEALEDLAKEHPHRALILRFNESENNSSADGDCGCGGHSSAEGGSEESVETPVVIKDPETKDVNDYHLKLTQQNIALGLIGFITLGLVINLAAKKS